MGFVEIAAIATVNAPEATEMPPFEGSMPQEYEKLLHEDDEPSPPHKLDLQYFMVRELCPLMVRQRARKAFELFLYLAHRWIEALGTPVSPTHEQLCAACGLRSNAAHSRSAISHLLRALRTTYGVIDFEPVKRRRPQITLRPASPGADPLQPRHYIYFYQGWSPRHRAIFDSLGPRALAAEYMYLIAEYEAALARVKHGRPYWFFPLERIAETYHVSTRFASVGLQALVDLGAMHIAFGQHERSAPNDEFGAANRYYFEGVDGILRREHVFERLRFEHEAEFGLACELAGSLTNGPTIKNVEGLCELIASHGEVQVRQAVEQVAAYARRSPRRRVEYIRGIVAGKRPAR